MYTEFTKKKVFELLMIADVSSSHHRASEMCQFPNVT